MFRFGGAQKVSGKLEEKLALHNLTVKQLFQTQNIIGDIKNNVNKFVTYCLNHRSFSTEIINLAFNTSMQQISEKELNAQVFVSTQFLSCDEDEVVDLFFQTQQIKNQSNLSEHIEEQKPESLLSEAQRLFQTQEKQIDTNQQNQDEAEQPFGKYQLLKIALKCLDNPIKNETSLGYLQSLINFLIRRVPNHVLQFFSVNRQYIQLLIEGLRYSSLGQILANLVSSEDKSSQYKYESLKKEIYDMVLKTFFDKINQIDTCQGIFIFIEESLNNTKQFYYQYFEDFKRCANILVSENVIGKIYEIITENNKESFGNAIRYLELIIKRINSQKDILENCQSTDKKPTMDFQLDKIFNNIESLLKLLGEIVNQQKLMKLNYFILILEIFKYPKISQYWKISFDFHIRNLMELMERDDIRGLLQNELYHIIEKIIQFATQNQIDQFTSNKQNFQQWIPKLFDTVQLHNKNQVICYQIRILLLIGQRNQNFIQIINSQQLFLKDIFEKYKTTLAKSPNPNIFGNKFTNFGKDKNIEITTSFGKKQIQIPSLNINNTLKSPSDSVEEEQKKSQETIYEHQVVQIIQVDQKFKEILRNQKQLDKYQLNEIDSPKKDDKKIQNIKQQQKLNNISRQQEKFYVKHVIFI